MRVRLIIHGILDEVRQLNISPPDRDGSYYIDYEFSFTALADEVVLDRTPIMGEPGGQSWGGYTGLSIRYSQELPDSAIIIPDNKQSASKNDYMYMGFHSKTRDTDGLSIFTHPRFSTKSTSWYVTTNSKLPFFYFLNLLPSDTTITSGYSFISSIKRVHSDRSITSVLTSSR